MTGGISNKQKSIKTIVGISIGALVIIIVQQFLFKVPSFDKQMMQAANEVNKACPIMVDQETRLDNSIAFPDNVFQYNYTLVNIEKKNINVSELEEYLKPVILNAIKTNPDLKLFRDHGTTMSYNYKDKNGEHLIKLLFTADQYK